MVRARSLVLIAALGLCSAGCVERRFVIMSEPYGAVVYNEKDLPMGLAPADQQFTYYGKYRFKLVKDGYQTKIVEQNVKAPWYEWPLIDFVSENLIPWTIRDRREFVYKLDPIVPVSPEQTLIEGQQLRERGMGIGAPLPQPPLSPQPLPAPPLPPPPQP